MSDRILGPSGGRRRRRFLALFSFAVLAALAFAIASFAGPVGTGQGFEDDDGNLNPQAPINFDWNSFADVTWSPHPATTPTRQTDDKTVSGFQFKGIEDYPNPGATSGTTADTSFNGGVKQDDNCAGVGNGKPPNKDDLSRVYLASKTGSNGHTYLDLAWARIPQNSTSASAHVGFEFNQSDTPCGAGSNGLVQRTTGDMLIVYDFEGGSAAPVLTLRRWYETASDAPGGVAFTGCEVSSDSAPCWGKATNLSALGFAEGKVNTASVTDALSPPALNSSTGTSVDRTLATQEFGEAGIDLTGAGVIPLGSCASFGKAYAVSRSSGNSAQAQMKDLVGPADFSLSNCGTIIIKKETTPPAADQNFGYTSTIAGTELDCTDDTSPASFNLNTGSATVSDTETCLNVPPSGATPYTVTENAPPTGWAFTGLSCTPSSGSSFGVQDGTIARQANITLASGGTVTCTYSNQQLQASSASAQRWLPNDRIVLTTNSGPLSGNLTATLYKGTFTVSNGVCTADASAQSVYSTGQIAVSGNSPQVVQTNNTTQYVGTNPGGTAGNAAGAYFWLIHYNDANAADPPDRCESSSVSITD
jgi:hypothetical protein